MTAVTARGGRGHSGAEYPLAAINAGSTLAVLFCFCDYVTLSKGGDSMRKEIEITGCVEIPPETDADTFVTEFLRWIEEKGWRFGGGFREIADGYYVRPDGSRGEAVSEE